MGIVLKQSFKNTVIIYLAFAVGGVNILFLYTNFIEKEYYGLIIFLLSTANLLMPLTAFGVQHSIVKFFSAYQSKAEKDKFLNLALILPLIIALPIGFVGNLFYEQISDYLAVKNHIIKEYTYVIYIVAILTAYFEIFYAWAKVQLQSVLGNVLKELFSRVAVTILLFLVYFKFITQVQFIYYLTGAYLIRMVLMMLYAFKLYLPKFTLKLPHNLFEVLKYSGYIIFAGSAGAILLDIDKYMLPRKEVIEYVAYYSVGVYIASVIEAPGRAMSQIVQPLTAKALNENNWDEIASLYKKSSINLLLISGLFFLLINVNISQLYLLLKDEYADGIWVVLMISTAKLYTMFLGNNGAIISNSKYYKILLPYGIIMAFTVYYLNNWLIDVFGMNGAALSTFGVVIIFNTLKIIYVKVKFGFSPSTNKTLPLFGVIILLFGLFYFWNFTFHPILNMVLKSSILGVIYLVLIKKMKISEDVNTILTKYFP